MNVQRQDETSVYEPVSDHSHLTEEWRAHGPGEDIADGLRAVHVWGTLGLHDIRQRYRRSVLGPFWFTLSTLIMVSVLGTIYATLLKQEVSDYVAFLAAGLIVWQYLSSVANEGCTVFTSVDYLIKQVRLPLTVHVVREVWRNFLILLHSLPIVILVLMAFGKMPSWEILTVPLGLGVLFLNGLWLGIVLGILCTRFRDVPPIVVNLVQIAFFFTPVMWSPEFLGDRSWIAEYNPLYHLIEVVRAPLLGHGVAFHSWMWAGAILVAGFVAAHFLMKKCRSRVPYWL
jgi:homopolymeric O-antigen transport system permease protein